MAKDTTHIKCICSFNYDQYQEIVASNDIIRNVEKDHNAHDLWKCKRTTVRKVSIFPHHHKYKESSYNVRTEWKIEEGTIEPIGSISANDPVSCAIYAKQQNLLDTPSWKKLWHIAKRQKKLFRMVNQSKLWSFRLNPKYKYKV